MPLNDFQVCVGPRWGRYDIESFKRDEQKIEIKSTLVARLSAMFIAFKSTAILMGGNVNDVTCFSYVTMDQLQTPSLFV